ncbi:MAG: hypothetical protein K2I94_01275 [Muribaculaceae bacterium]|nr:hypothetical protein [Muribaculaceae bacterium]
MKKLLTGLTLILAVFLTSCGPTPDSVEKKIDNNEKLSKEDIEVIHKWMDEMKAKGPGYEFTLSPSEREKLEQRMFKFFDAAIGEEFDND